MSYTWNDTGYKKKYIDKGLWCQLFSQVILSFLISKGAGKVNIIHVFIGHHTLCLKAMVKTILVHVHIYTCIDHGKCIMCFMHILLQ